MGPGFPWLENFDDAAQADFELVNWVEATEADFDADDFKDVAPGEGLTPMISMSESYRPDTSLSTSDESEDSSELEHPLQRYSPPE